MVGTSRASSEPPVGLGLEVNPFFSAKTRKEIELQLSRPAGLPEQSPGSDMHPVRDVCTGKGRGGQAAGSGNFETPPNKLQGHVPAGRGLGARCSDGKMPDERVEPMGALRTEGSMHPHVDELQRSLEVEVVNHLREQNTKLLEELEWYRQQRRSSDSGLGSNASWVEVATGEGEKSVDNTRGGGVRSGQDCKTPRGGSTFGRESRFTPNGTRVPDGTPPTDEPRVKQPVSLPPVPPFPLVEDDFASLDQYEISEDVSKVRVLDRPWKPSCEKSREPTPGEARAFWLEKEVASLKNTLASMVNGNAFQNSEYWNGQFQSSGQGGVAFSKSGSAQPQFSQPFEAPTNLGRPDPVLAERISRANPGDRLCHSLGGCGDNALPDRADESGIGGSGGHFLQARASTMDGARHGVYPGHLRGGSGDVSLQDRAGTLDAARREVCPGHSLGGCHADQRGDRALHGGDSTGLGSFGGLESLQPGHQEGAIGALRPDVGGVSMIPQSWETGGGGNTRAELPELPGLASPLQFGDWLHLCGPVMRDLSSVASRWWDLTVRQAQTHYADWKQATPLQRVQLQPHVPDELHDRCYGRTEQRGVHLLLKAVAQDLQQQLVTDRQLTSTAILYRLYVRYQPGGPGEKSLILKELTQLPKTQTMAELGAALRNWRRHFGRAREVGASLPDGTLLLKALEQGVQLVAKENSQAAFRLAQSRATLHVDEAPTPSTIWDFSQCLLAEAETLVLMNATATTPSEAVPLKLKQMHGDPKTPSRSTTNEAPSKSSSAVDKPCKYFISESGCKAGSKCKWLHSWDGVTDKA